MPPILGRQAELKPIDEQPNYHLIHLDGFGKASGLSYQAFDPGPEGEMFPFQLLSSPLADYILV